MELTRILFLFLFISKNALETHSFIDPASIAMYGAAISTIAYLLKNSEHDSVDVVRKQVRRAVKKVGQMIGYYEGCEDYWIPANLNGLDNDLRSSVFGQQIAVDTIMYALKYHLKNKNPSKSLVLSFQGSPGTGKNFASQMILKNMFRKGDQTEYVKFFRGSIDFPLKENVGQYKKEIIQTVREMVYECHRSVFVFDEVEKMPDGILDTISGFVSAKKEGDYDYRRVIFILLSNVGSEALAKTTLNAWKNGIKREDMDEKELSKLVALEAFNSEGGLYQTRLIRNHDISYYVPFLPLERYHVIKCLEKEVSKLDQVMSPEMTELVLEELNFIPEPERIFATAGCKGVAEKANMLIERELRKRRKYLS